MTDEELAAIRARHERDQALRHDWPTPPHPAHADRAALLAEVERLRADAAALREALAQIIHRTYANRSRRGCIMKTLDEAMRRAAENAGRSMQVPTIGRLSAHWERKGSIARDAVLASLAADGWVLVPREATQAMVDAGIAPRGYTVDGYANTHDLSDKWRAMLAAAPTTGGAT